MKPPESNEYKIGHEYIDDIANSNSSDQFVKWLPGIGNSKGIRPAKSKNEETKLPAFIILVTRNVSHKHHNPWDDIVDYGSSTIFYWGDAKFSHLKNYKDFDGNRCLIAVYEKYLDGNLSEIPPILHFSKRQKGKVTFNGLCIIKGAQLTWFEDEQKPVKNYRFELTILDEEKVNVSWLLKRIQSIRESNSLAPESWVSFISGRVRKLNLLKKEILKREDQLPPTSSRERKILEALVGLKAVEFEAFLVDLIKELPHVSHNVTRTRFVKDGGFDFHGDFILPFPFSYKIEFLGEAKKYNLNNPVKPENISRLVARLGRGQYGIFFTTSYYTRQAQEEVLQDEYPVRLYSGLDIINMLRELKLIEGDSINRKWMDNVLKNIAHDRARI